MQIEMLPKNTQGIDLHCHSHFSDGSLSPEELISLAKQYDIHSLAITDHDTLAAHHYLRDQPILHNAGVKLIAGIELSTRWHPDPVRLDNGEGLTLHIVGLNLDIDNAELIQHISLTQNARQERNKKILQRMIKKGWDDVVERVKDETSLTRTHLAKAMLATQKVNNYNAAFRKYLGQGKPLNVHTLWPPLSETIRAIHAAGGVAVLAHPLHYKLSRKKLLKLCSDFKQLNGDALEVVSGNAAKSDIDNLTGLALRCDLQVSIGSDFHGPERFKARLGVEQDIAKSLKPIWHNW